MLKTLYSYIARDLVRVTLLALTALTLLFTVVMIMKPLRQKGLSPEQVAQLFVYMLPWTVTFTLPIAALFASTVIYGRFSQDRELLACRASGVSTLSLLTPGLLLATVATCISLVLTNFVAPDMAARAERAVHQNIRGLTYNQFRSRGYIEGSPGAGEKLLVRARPDESEETLRDVVVVYMRGPGEPPFVSAVASARPSFFRTEHGEHYLSVDVVDATGDMASQRVTAGHQPIPPVKLPNPLEHKPEWYGWGKLLRAIRDPSALPQIGLRVADIRRHIAHDLICQEVAESLSGPSSEWRFEAQGRTFLLRAGRANANNSGGVRLRADGGKPVSATYCRDGVEVPSWREQLHLALAAGPGGAVGAPVHWQPVLPATVTADDGAIETDYDPRAERSRAELILTERVQVTPPGGGEPTGREEWRITAPLPVRYSDQVKGVTLADLAADKGFSRNPRIRNPIDNLLNEVLPRERSKLIAEMHFRVAFGASCFLLVAIGGGLGILLKGGQLLSGFAVSLLPSLPVVVLILTGKEMARNIDVPLVVGIGVMWSGVAALFLGGVWLYAHLARK